jgi:hypothetical protein
MGSDDGMPSDHVRFNDMQVSKLVLSQQAQAILVKLQTFFLDRPYAVFGKTEDSSHEYNVVCPSSFGSDRRKPVTARFQSFVDGVYAPIVYALLFGSSGRETIRQHLVSFKTNTIKVCEQTAFCGENIFHFHLDGKIGVLQEKNHTQKHMVRLLFSLVPDALVPPAAPLLSTTTALPAPPPVAPKPASGGSSASATGGGALAAPAAQLQADVKHGCTVYPIWQPRCGFRNNHEFHRYMSARYPEHGHTNGFPRPLYGIPEDQIYRSLTGEVLVHKSHADSSGPQPIHAEANPCPDRYLFVFDFENVNQLDTRGQLAGRSTEIPEGEIVAWMAVLAEGAGAAAFTERWAEVVAAADAIGDDLLQPLEELHPDPRAAVHACMAEVSDSLLV